MKRENIVNEFYDLSTGVAGEILQKLSNYSSRIAIIGNFEDIKSKSFEDFMFESNKTRKIVFVKTIEEAIKILDIVSQ